MHTHTQVFVAVSRKSAAEQKEGVTPDTVGDTVGDTAGDTAGDSAPLPSYDACFQGF